MSFHTEVGLGPGYIVLDGDPAPPPPKGHSPEFSAHVCCGQTTGWIPLGREVGLGPGHTVLDEDLAPPPQNDTAANFLSMSIMAKRSPISATAEHLLLFELYASTE